MSGLRWVAELLPAQAKLVDDGARLRFKVDNAQARFVLALENDDPTYRRFAVYGHDGYLNVQYNDGSGWREPTTLIPSLQADVWYVLTFGVDNLRGMTLEVYKESDPARRYTQGCSVLPYPNVIQDIAQSHAVIE